MGHSKEYFNQLREQEAVKESLDYTKELKLFNELAPKNLTSDQKAQQFISNLKNQNKL